MQPSPDTLQMIERLVAFDTTSRNSNLELIDYVREYPPSLARQRRSPLGRALPSR